MVLRALRAQIKQIEDGIETSTYYVQGIDDLEHGMVLIEAENYAECQIEPDGEYPEEVNLVSWGIMVPVEIAHVDVVSDDNMGEAAKAYGFDEWWDVSLVDAWPDCPEPEE